MRLTESTSLGDLSLCKHQSMCLCKLTCCRGPGQHECTGHYPLRRPLLTRTLLQASGRTAHSYKSTPQTRANEHHGRHLPETPGESQAAWPAPPQPPVRHPWSPPLWVDACFCWLLLLSHGWNPEARYDMHFTLLLPPPATTPTVTSANAGGTSSSCFHRLVPSLAAQDVVSSTQPEQNSEVCTPLEDYTPSEACGSSTGPTSSPAPGAAQLFTLVLCRSAAVSVSRQSEAAPGRGRACLAVQCVDRCSPLPAGSPLLLVL